MIASFMILLGLLFAMLISVFMYALYILAIAFTLWMVVDAGKQDRFWWLLLIVGVPIIGPGVYYFVQKKHEYKRASHMHVERSETEEQHEKAPEGK